MDDLAAMITQFLGSEDGMNQLRSVASALGMSEDTGAAGNAADSPSERPSGSVGGMDFTKLFGGSQPSGSPPSSEGGGIDLHTVMLLQRAVSAYGQPDPNTDLLRALKPLFSPERAKKVDDAVRILQLLKMLPLLKDSGLFGTGEHP